MLVLFLLAYLRHHSNKDPLLRSLVNSRDVFNQTALHWAAYQSTADICRWLVWYGGALVDEPDGYGLTALHWASLRNEPDVIAALLNDLNADRRPLTGLPMLTATITSELSTEIIEEIGVRRGQTAMQLARQRFGNEKALEIFGDRMKQQAANSRKTKIIRRIAWISPAVWLTVLLAAFEWLPWYYALPLSALTLSIGHFLIMQRFNQLHMNNYSDQSPFAAGFFQSMLAFAAVFWLFLLLPSTVLLICR
jgi:hypothetical protein